MAPPFDALLLTPAHGKRRGMVPSKLLAPHAASVNFDSVRQDRTMRVFGCGTDTRNLGHNQPESNRGERLFVRGAQP